VHAAAARLIAARRPTRRIDVDERVVEPVDVVAKRSLRQCMRFAVTCVMTLAGGPVARPIAGRIVPAAVRIEGLRRAPTLRSWQIRTHVERCPHGI
jgi:hypothetical protein